jgi:hypothetical protein
MLTAAPKSRNSSILSRGYYVRNVPYLLFHDSHILSETADPPHGVERFDDHMEGVTVLSP